MLNKELFLHSGGAENETVDMRDSIINSQDNLNITGTIYYVSQNGNDENDGMSIQNAKKTLLSDIFVSDVLKPGDAVLFERGGIWRTEESIITKTGVTYGAYGKGKKPEIYASKKNYAQKSLWQQSVLNENIWIAQMPHNDVGIVVFDENSVGEKRIALNFADASLKENGEFYHDIFRGHLYLYCDGGNPGEVYNSIEIGLNNPIIRMQGDDIVIDNLCLKYSGAFGITAGNNHNIIISNCEFGWIGGSIAAYRSNGNTFIQYGNAIEFWYRCYNVSVTNCWIHQIYDAAFTFQGKGKDIAEFLDISFTNNLIEYCSMNFECWAGNQGIGSKIHNVLVKENIFRFSGYGWGGLYRRDKGNQAFILFWNNHFEDMQNFVITDNVFDCADSNFVWGVSPATQNGLVVTNNIYYQKKTSGVNPYTEVIRSSGRYAENQFEFETAIKEYEVTPKKIKWLDNM